MCFHVQCLTCDLWVLDGGQKIQGDGLTVVGFGSLKPHLSSQPLAPRLLCFSMLLLLCHTTQKQQTHGSSHIVVVAQRQRECHAAI